MDSHMKVLFRSIPASVLALLLLASFGGGAAASYDYKKEPDPRTSEYTVGPLDQRKGVRWKNQGPPADSVVPPDGVVTLPLTGKVKGAGRTPTQIQKKISSAM